MSSSGYLFIPDEDDSDVGTLVAVYSCHEGFGLQLASIVDRDGRTKAAEILAAHEWRLINSDHEEDGEVGRFGGIPGYGEYYAEDPEDLSIQADYSVQDLNSLRRRERHVYTLELDGEVTL